MIEHVEMFNENGDLGFFGDKVEQLKEKEGLVLFVAAVANHEDYAATYCSGNLIARLSLKNFNSDETSEGKGKLEGVEHLIKDKVNDAEQGEFAKGVSKVVLL